MARPLRFECPGAIYHIMARGDGGKVIFIEKEDHLHPLDLVKKGSKILVKKGSHAAAPIRRHGEFEAEKIVVKGLKQLGLVDEAGCLSPSRKGDPRKVALASVVKSHTSVGNEWLAVRLEMGHNRSVSRLIRQGNNDDKIKKLYAKLTKL